MNRQGAARRTTVRGVWLVLLALGAGTLEPASAQDSVTVTAGDYGAGWLKRWLFGKDYRDLWATPIRVAVLQLDRFAGGLTPVRTGGYGQTISLHFDGADGRRYVFRSIDKDLSRRLEEGLLGTFVEDIIQDQTSAYHPAAALVTAPLADAAGILATTPELAVMPDDPALGEFREGYAGMLGLIMENPDEGPDDTPGFAGSRRVSGSDRVLEDTEESPSNRVDVVGFLKARLFDIFVGDRDRHKGQWKWARFAEGDGYRWEVVAEDRDQPFVKQDGVILWVARTAFVRKLTNFSPDYRNLIGLTWNGWDLDRRFFAGLERPVWDSVALDLQRRLTDDVIEHAVAQMPPPYYEKRGAQLEYELKTRRDNLPTVATDYYRLLSGYVDIHATDEDEVITVTRNADETVRVAIALTPSATPHFQRTFLPGETRELRIYLRGGEDRAVVRGPGKRIKVRIIGGGGPDHLADASEGPTYFYDGGGRTEIVEGGGTRVDRRDFTPPPSADFAHEQPPDWGYWVRPAPGLSYRPDFGLFLGGGFTRYQYGFRKFPYSSRVTLKAGFAFGAQQPTLELELEQREIRPKLHFELGARITGLDVIRFHGFGNNTEISGSDAFYGVNQTRSDLSLGLAVEPSARVRFSLGTVGRVSNTDDDEDTFLVRQGPDFYGAGTFWQLGFRGGFRFDTRDRPVAASRGLVFEGGGTLWPSWMSVDETYGELHGLVAAYFTAGPTLALRAGGQRVFGTFPFLDAAYVGGSSTLRGFAEHRFAGHASLFGNAELRFRLARTRIIFPGGIGVLAIGDLGRVFSDGDTPGEKTWHGAYGGGLWYSVLDPMNTLSLSIVTSKERTGLYVNAGFAF